MQLLSEKALFFKVFTGPNPAQALLSIHNAMTGLSLKSFQRPNIRRCTFKQIRINPLYSCYKVTMTLSAIFKTLADAKIYRCDFSRLLRQAAVEEYNHANTLRLALKIRVDVISNSLIDPLEAGYLLQYATNLLKMIGEKPPVPEDALRILIEIKEMCSIFHTENAFTFKSEFYKTFFRVLSEANENQLVALKSALDDLLECKNKKEFERRYFDLPRALPTAG